MPGFDGTGPWGGGPMTGGGRGFCNPAGYGGMVGRGRGRGGGFRRWWGAGFGRGRGFGRGFAWRAFSPAWGGAYPPAYGSAPYAMEPADEMASLKADAEAMREELAEIEKRMQELAKE